MTKTTKKIDVKTEKDLLKLTKPELLAVSTVLLNQVNEVVNSSNSFFEDESKRQTHVIAEHSLEKQRLFTILDMMNNVKELLTAVKPGEFSPASKIYVLEDEVTTIANNTLRTCLSQIDEWLINNKIVKTKQKKI